MMHESVSSDPPMGMRVGGQQQISHQQQPLPSVSHVMGPLPGQYRSSSSYASPQSSQPATPIHPSSMAPSPLAPSPTPGPVRMLSLPPQNPSPLPTPSMQTPTPMTFVRPPDPSPMQNSHQMHVISSTQYPAAEMDRSLPSTNDVFPKPQTDQQTPKEKYRQLKTRFKFLVYENECYQEELRNLQRKLLKLSRDKNFLLDRLQPYEMLSNSSDESDSNSVKTVEEKPKVPKKKSRPSAPRRRPPLQKLKSVGSSQLLGRSNVLASSFSVKVEDIKGEVDGGMQFVEQKGLSSHDDNSATNGQLGGSQQQDVRSTSFSLPSVESMKREV